MDAGLLGLKYKLNVVFAVVVVTTSSYIGISVCHLANSSFLFSFSTFRAHHLSCCMSLNESTSLAETLLLIFTPSPTLNAIDAPSPPPMNLSLEIEVICQQIDTIIYSFFLGQQHHTSQKQTDHESKKEKGYIP